MGPCPSHAAPPRHRRRLAPFYAAGALALRDRGRAVSASFEGGRARPASRSAAPRRRRGRARRDHGDDPALKRHDDGDHGKHNDNPSGHRVKHDVNAQTSIAPSMSRRQPTVNPAPTGALTHRPTEPPTYTPTPLPTHEPTAEPSYAPSYVPTTPTTRAAPADAGLDAAADAPADRAADVRAPPSPTPKPTHRPTEPPRTYAVAVPRTS